jgi:hypothetical protein
LTGKVASKKVTGVIKGEFLSFKNLISIMAKKILTVRITIRTEINVGHSDPIMLYGKFIVNGKKARRG